MRVIVLGGGVVGVTTAYQLARDGHEVVLLERRDQVAEETSWGNAGMIAPGHSFVWSSPSAPKILLKSIFDPDQALRFKPSLDPKLWSWSLRFLAQCTAARARRNTLIKHRLCVYSQQVFQETAADTGIAFDRLSKGILYFYETEEGLARGIARMKILQDDGQTIEVADRKRVIEIDPSLAHRDSGIAGGVYAPTDETGDCSKFTKGLAAEAERLGVEIRTGVTITRMLAEGGRITGVETDKGAVKGDAYVLALGNYSAGLASGVGLNLPVYPIKGYSLTVPIGNRKHPPKVASVDEDRLVAITPMGDRVRVTATAEFSGYDTSHKPSDFAFMTSVMKKHYPDGGDYDRAGHWAGLRPMTPEGTPILGRAPRHENLYLNTGQGHMGWTMSHASARITADVIAGRKTAIPLDGMTAR